MNKKHAEFLVSLANQLDQEGKYDLADQIDENFEEFLKLLENGKLVFDYEFSGGARDPRGPYNNRGRELPIYGIPGPQ